MSIGRTKTAYVRYEKDTGRIRGAGIGAKDRLLEYSDPDLAIAFTRNLIDEPRSYYYDLNLEVVLPRIESEPQLSTVSLGVGNIHVIPVDSALSRISLEVDEEIYEYGALAAADGPIRFRSQNPGTFRLSMFHADQDPAAVPEVRRIRFEVT